MKWWEGHLVALDTETTGQDPLDARIVTASVVHIPPPGQGRPSSIDWYIDPGIDIPTEAANVHGWTTERLHRLVGRGGALRIYKKRRQTTSPDQALFEIAAQLGTAFTADAPVIVMNAAYDLTVLESELVRHDLPTLSSRPLGIRGIVDTRVLEKAFDPFRKVCYKAPGCNPEADRHECGGCRGERTPGRGRPKHACGGCGATNRKLLGMCAHYGVPHGGAHGARDDAIAAARVAVKVIVDWPDTARLKLGTLHAHQASWAKEQADGLRDWWTKTGDPRAASVDGGWPLHSQLETRLSAHLDPLIGAPS